MLTIEDDGSGFEPGSAKPREAAGLGLRWIKGRVTDARGTVRVESAPGRGTRITVDTHRAHVFERLDLHSVAEVVLYAVRRGLIR